MTHPAVRSAPILTVAGALGIEVVGRHARCFNSEKHRKRKDERPSLAFFPDDGRFRCYSCGIRGDSIDLVRTVRQCGFGEAVGWIESLTGETSSPSRSATANAAKSRRRPGKEALEIYAALYEMSYEIGPKMPAGRYLKRRGLNLDLVNEHRVTQMGDVRRTWSQLESDFGIDALKTAGVVSRAGRFLFARHELLFFYFDDDWPVYIQARDITGESRAKELSLTGLVSPIPYNVNLLRHRQRRVYLCEGCIDTLSALQMGFPAVGVPGVAGFQDDWYERFKTIEHIVVVFDDDEAGRREAGELRMQFRQRGIKADAKYPPSGKDMNDLLAESHQRKANVSTT